MTENKKERVYAYFDGSNFYHHVKKNYGIININFYHLTNQMLNLQKQELIRIKYFNSPVNQQEDAFNYSKQQKFFVDLKKTPLLDLYLGRLVKRPLSKINIMCYSCGHQEVENLTCPKCGKTINVTTCYKSNEKGVDVKLAMSMLLDALEDKYDVALLFSGDADFSPAIRYIQTQKNKKVIFCHFPHPVTYELKQVCSNSLLITKDIVKKSQKEFI